MSDLLSPTPNEEAAPSAEASPYEDWRAPLAKIWHRTFGEVKCHGHAHCPVCRDTDWPLASWVLG